MSVITAAMVYGGQWMLSTLLEVVKIQASQGTQIKVNTERIDRVENIGSPQLATHVKDDDTRIAAHQARIEKLEAAVLALQATPGELKAIGVELRNLSEGQHRIEKALEAHMQNERPKQQSYYWSPGIDLTNRVWEGLTNQNIRGTIFNSKI